MLTLEQKEQYLKDGGTLCPFCRSNDLSTDNMQIDGGTMTEDIECLNCGEQWQDSYTLTRITEI